MIYYRLLIARYQNFTGKTLFTFRGNNYNDLRLHNHQQNNFFFYKCGPSNLISSIRELEQI